MYSRYSSSDRSVQIPEHYSGCAFPKPTASTPPHPPPTPPSAPIPPKTPPPPPIKIPPPAPPAPHEPPTSPLFSAGLDFDQLLLLGLMLLLWGNECDRDIVLWLGLLLLWS